MELHYTAKVGVRNAAWLTDPDNFDGETVATDHGDGTVTITREQMDILRDMDEPGREEPGDLDWDDEHGLYLYLPYDASGGDRVTGFALTQRHGAADAPKWVEYRRRHADREPDPEEQP